LDDGFLDLIWIKLKFRPSFDLTLTGTLAGSGEWSGEDSSELVPSDGVS